MEKELYDVLDLMKRMGEEVYPGTLFETRLEMNPLIIEEGLIKSYPIEQVMRSVAEVFGLSVNGKYEGISPEAIKTGIPDKPNGDMKKISFNDRTDCISVKLPKDSKVKEKMVARFLKYGWFNSQTTDEGEEDILLFERKFGDRFTAKQLRNMTEKIYHITSVKLKKKIMEKGLLPRETKIPYSNEPRIFFDLLAPTKEDLADMQALKMSQEPMMVVEVDLNKVEDGLAFFYDSRWTNSIFTFEPISPKALRIIEESELLKFSLKNPFPFRKRGVL